MALVGEAGEGGDLAEGLGAVGEEVFGHVDLELEQEVFGGDAEELGEAAVEVVGGDVDVFGDFLEAGGAEEMLGDEGDGIEHALHFGVAGGLLVGQAVPVGGFGLESQDGQAGVADGQATQAGRAEQAVEGADADPAGGGVEAVGGV